MKLIAIKFALARVLDRFDDWIARNELRRIDEQLDTLTQAQDFHMSVAQQCAQRKTDLQRDRIFLAFRVAHQDDQELA